MYRELTSFETINGLRTVLVHLPHFRTHSARLVVHAGSAHEATDSHGAAHFLEHIAFQGTAELPSEKAVYDYAESKGIGRNAKTNRLATTYIADGFELEPVGFLVSQLAFEPLLTRQSLEAERKPIIEEVRANYSDPYFQASLEHSRTYRGDEYARPVTGTIDEVKSLTLEPLKAFHEQNYTVQNASLILCSAEPLTVQRQFVEHLTRKYPTISKDGASIAHFDDFNPLKLTYSPQLITADKDSQTHVSIGYGLPAMTTTRGQMAQNVVGIILSKMAHNRLRRDLALCYGASAGTNWLADSNYGRYKKWSHLVALAKLDGADSVAALAALYNDVMLKPLDKDVYDAVVISLKRDYDIQSENTPAYIADRILPSLDLGERSNFALDEVIQFADTITLDELRSIQQRMTATKPLVLATSVSQPVLDDISKWTEQNIR